MLSFYSNLALIQLPGACMAEGVHGKGVCMVGGMRGRGACAWWGAMGGVHGR